MHTNKTYKSKSILFLALLLWAGTNMAQISPPGLGRAQTASWMALGIRKNLDSAAHRQSLTYLGWGRISDPKGGDANPFKKQAIWVLNHEVYNHYTDHWQYSYALSYRRQNKYEEELPFKKEGIEQELRLYGRYSYLLENGPLKGTVTLRQEFRKFFDADFHKAAENLQLRTRVKGQLAYRLNEHGQKLLLSAEALLATSRMYEPHSYWTAYQYKESRFGLYYAFNIPHSAYSMDVGYVNNLIRSSAGPVDVHYLAVDFIWNLPNKQH